VFATLLGALPRPDAESSDGDGDGAGDDDDDRLIEIAVRAQEEAGLEPITDGRLRGHGFERLPTPQDAINAWQATQAMTDRAVKQALPMPRSVAGSPGSESGAMALAVAGVVQALAEAGCPLIEIEEASIDRLSDPGERARFRDAHEQLLERVSGIHVSLSIVGGAPDPSAWETVLGLPYASLAVDLIAGPDSWNLVTRWAGERGVVAGVESGRSSDEPKEVLLWAAHYAASTRGRGMDRVGLGSAGTWANLTWEAAVRKMGLLGEAARLATLPPGGDLARELDPKAVSSRRAALGHDARPGDV
jgi:hypothetical protein